MVETTPSPCSHISFPWFVRALHDSALAHWIPTLVIFGNIFSKIVALTFKVLHLCAEGLVLELKVNSDDAGYGWLWDYLHDGRVWDDMTTFTVSTDPKTSVHGSFTVANDVAVFFRFKGTLCHVTSSAPPNRYKQLTVKFFTRKHQVVKDLMAAAYEHHLAKPTKSREESEKTSTKYVPDSSYHRSWMASYDSIEKRPSATIAPDGLKEGIVEDIKTFLAAKDQYVAMGLPHCRRYLIYGPPGAGKMTAIYAVAAELGKNMYRLNVDLSSLSDAKFANLVATVPKGDVLVIENVDSVFPPRGVPKTEADGLEKKQETCRISLAGLMSAIEGKNSDDSKVIFVVSKYLVPDPILLRKGRVDFPVRFGFATRTQVVALFKQTYDGLPSVNADEEGRPRPLTPPPTPPEHQSKTSCVEEAEIETSVELFAEQFAEAIPEDRYLMKEIRQYLFAMRGLDPTEVVKGVEWWMRVLDDEKRRVAGEDGLL